MATSTLTRHIQINENEMRQISESKGHVVRKTNTKKASAKKVLARLRTNAGK